MQVKISNWVIFGFLILVGLLIFSLIRGCDNSKKNTATEINFKERIKKLEQDSVAQATQREAYFDTTEFLNGQLELSNNKLLSLTENLDSANDRIATLLNKHIPIAPSPDTTFTTVPNEYLNECSDCFTELDNGRRLVSKYRAEKESQDKTYKSLLSVKDNRINTLEQNNRGLLSSYKSLIDSTGKLEQRRTLYLKLGALAINQSLPNGIGAGLMYQDKRKRIFSVGYYITEYKTVYQAEVALPLSLRKLK